MAEAKPRFTMGPLTFNNIDSNSELEIMCKFIRVDIRMTAENFDEVPAIKEEYLHNLRLADAFQLNGRTVEDFFDWITEPFFPIFDQMLEPTFNGQPTLENILFPTVLTYTLRASNGVRVPSVMVGAVPQERTGARVSEELLSLAPSFQPNQVEVLPVEPNTAETYLPRKVFVNGQFLAFFKPYDSGDESEANTEVSAYKKIAEAKFDDAFHVTRLLGFVRKDQDRILGILVTYVDSGFRSLRLARSLPRAIRQKWTTQIANGVNQLHQAGIVWGDVKPENVLIDQNDDAWLTDFKGGYTHGWIDKELAMTVQGDRQGLAKILRFLNGGSE